MGTSEWGMEEGGDCLWFTSNCTVYCRQAYRTLHQLLGYDPTGVPPGQPGYGSGSGAPDIMFGFLKHLWATHSRQDALARYSLLCNGTRMCTGFSHLNICWRTGLSEAKCTAMRARISTRSLDKALEPCCEGCRACG